MINTLRFTFAFLACPDAEAFSFFGIHIFRVRPRFGRIHEGAAQVHAGRYRTQVRPAEGRQDCADTSRGRLPYSMQFLPCYDHDLYFDGRLIKPMNWFPGATSIYDLRLDPVADVRDPFHSLMFHLPRKALDAMAYGAGVPRVGDLRHMSGYSRTDARDSIHEAVDQVIERWRHPSVSP